MRNRTSGFLSASHCRTGWYAWKIGAHDGSSCFCRSSANPIVGEWEVATPPKILAIKSDDSLSALRFDELRRVHRHIYFHVADDGCEPAVQPQERVFERELDSVYV